MEERRNSQSSSGSVIGSVVACAVIVLIVGYLLYPAVFRGGSPIAPRRSCFNNLKQLAVAVHVYVEDHDGVLPSSALVNDSPKWDRGDYLTFATGGTSFPPSGRKRTWPELVHAYVKAPDILVCPCDTEATRTDTYAMTSYHWRLAVDKAWYGVGCVKPCRKLDDYCGLSDCILLYERCNWHDEKPVGLTKGASISAVFMDGHVKRVTLKNTTSGNLNNCAANSDGSPMYFNHDTKTNTTLPENTPATYVDPGRYIDKFN